MKTIDFKKKQVILLFCICFSIQVFGQWQVPQDYPSPNAANLGLYGQIPVSHFTGTPNINIPVHTIQLRDFQLPIELRYHIGSVKPDMQPGWTGLGWTLSAGGSITRIINGIRDETTKTDFARETGKTPSDHIGFYHNASILINASNWTTSSFLMNYSINSIPKNEYKTNVDFEPDEFLFNFAGLSGSFFYNGKSGTKDQFKIKSQQMLDLDISMVIANTTTYDQLEIFKKATYDFAPSEKKLTLQTYFSKFTIIDQNGIKYEFGGNNDAIDFTTTVKKNNTITTAVTWYLTSITTPNGDYIQFKYKKEGDLFVATEIREKIEGTINLSGCDDFNPSIDHKNYLSILHLSYLDQITTSAGETINFNSSVSDELGYNYNNINISQMGYLGLTALDKAKQKAQGNYKLKLDDISIYNTTPISNTTKPLKKFYFRYDNVSTKRLHLDTLRTDQYKYVFLYNTPALPAYNAKQSDNWGFYNGYYYGSTPYSTLKGIRAADEIKMIAETLKEIIYPTGGSTRFEYQAHNYSKISTIYLGGEILVNLLNESGTAGGLRIYKIISRPDRTSATGEVVKEYLYAYPDYKTSGILSGWPVYRTVMTSPTLNATATRQSENFLNPLGNTNGAYVTYSRVVEKMSDGSSSVYYYTNHEDQQDESAIFGISNVFYENIFIAPFTSKEVGRGLLKAEVHKNSQGVTVDSTYYEYRYPYESFVKSISRNTHYFRCFNFDQMICYKQYACIPNLSKKTEIRYDITGKNPVTTTTNYTYNSKNLLSTIDFTRSDGKKQTDMFTYPFEITQGTDATILQKMTDKHILSDYVEKVTYLGSNQLVEGEYRKFNETKVNSSGIFKPERIDWLPKKSITLNSQSAHYLPQIYYTYYSQGNLKESKPAGSAISTTYLWGYKHQYLIAKIENATYESVRTALGYTNDSYIEYMAAEENADVATISNKLRTNSNLQQAFVTTYTYKPLVGMLTMTDPRGVVTNYEYDDFGRLKKVIQAGKVIESYDYHYKN